MLLENPTIPQDLTAATPTFALLRRREPLRLRLLGDLGYFLSRKPAPPANETSFWRDVFVPSQQPWTTFLESLVYHALVVAAILAWGQWRPAPRISLRDPWKDTKLVVYPATAAQKPDLPKLDTGSAGIHRAQAGDPALASQPILSVPREPDNRAQTIVTPPEIVLHSTVRMPNIVAWSALPLAPAPALTVLASERTVMAPALSVVAPAPQIDLAHRNSLTMPRTAVVAPPPAIEDAPQRSQPTLATAVVPPPPSVEASQPLGNLILGPTKVVAPAPQLPMGEPRTLRASASQQAAGQALSGSVVPPPPSLSSDTASRSGRMIALSVNPVAPSQPPPAGNRRGEFSANPQGREQGSGRPAITESGKAASASTGGTATVPGLPAGIRIDDAEASPNGRGGAESLASITIDRHPIAASVAPTRVNTANRKPAVLSERTPSETERKVFGGRRYYQMMLNMPNLNSAGGTWVIRFAELKAGAAQGELFSPLLTLKSDPAYPSELQRANVQGTVTLYAIIHSNGSVGDIRVLDGADERLDQYAAEALARCRFEPALKGGVPVALEAVVAIPFRARKEF